MTSVTTTLENGLHTWREARSQMNKNERKTLQESSLPLLPVLRGINLGAYCYAVRR
jgi:hypothetical protein